MKSLHDKVAVITGAASGIGFGISRAFADAGIKLVMADVESATLEAAGEALRGDGACVVTQCVDVAESEALEALAETAYRQFGRVNILCNNAGVIENNLAVWEYPLDDWKWVLGVNLMGVVHGIRAFVPRMLRAGEPGHVVNTASLGGLITGTANPIYTLSKHAVVALSENLQNDFVSRDVAMQASVLCPGWVRTDIVDSDRNRRDAPALSPSLARIRERFRAGVDSGIEPELVGHMVVEAIRDKRFYIHTHPQWMELVEARLRAIIEGKAPVRSRIPNRK